MNPLLITLLSFIAIASLLLWRARANTLKHGPTLWMANIAEGTHDQGEVTYYADAAVTERFLLAKRGGAANRIAVCGAADTPIGVLTDEVATALDPVNVILLGGCVTQTVKMVASAAIAQDALVEPAANGRVATLGAGAGTHHVVGRAITAAGAAGDVIEVVPMYFLRVI